MVGSQYPQDSSQQPQYEAPMYQGPPYAPVPKKKFPIGKIIGIIVILVIVFGVIYVLAGTSARATLTVNVINTHSDTISYEVYIEGELDDSDTLPYDYYMEYQLNLYPGSSCKTYTVSASSTGGSQGPKSDEESVELCPGDKKTVDLYV